jgi:hypothetical protein
MAAGGAMGYMAGNRRNQHQQPYSSSSSSSWGYTTAALFQPHRLCSLLCYYQIDDHHILHPLHHHQAVHAQRLPSVVQSDDKLPSNRATSILSLLSEIILITCPVHTSLPLCFLFSRKVIKYILRFP